MAKVIIPLIGVALVFVCVVVFGYFICHSSGEIQMLRHEVNELIKKMNENDVENVETEGVQKLRTEMDELKEVEFQKLKGNVDDLIQKVKELKNLKDMVEEVERKCISAVHEREEALDEVKEEMEEERKDVNVTLEAIRDEMDNVVEVEIKKLGDQVGALAVKTKVLEQKVEDQELSSGTTAKTLTTTMEMNVDRSNCQDILNHTSDHLSDGVFNITVDGKEVSVWCDMTTDGGGWNVFQKRGQFGLREDFFDRNWKEYEEGFGDPRKEYWLGLSTVSKMTSVGSFILRVDMTFHNNTEAFAEYSDFRLDPSPYALQLGEFIAGNTTDGMSFHKGVPFSTKDRDNDPSAGHCATTYAGAWWFDNCFHTNLNGRNFNKESNSNYRGIIWDHRAIGKYSLPRVQMKFRKA